ncbi:GNAT family N-acetyltransferase [Mucilaginibacter koreensis]
MPIVNATFEDITDLTALINSAYRGESSRQGWTTESNLLDGMRIDEAAMQEYFANPEVTILKYISDSGELAGCVYLEKVKDNRLYLGMLTVKPTIQAQGIGRQLLQEAERIATALDIEAIKISVIPVRHELIAWYERRGYAATGQMLPFPTDTRFGIPRQPLELMVMEKALS